MAVTTFLKVYNFGLGFLATQCTISATTITLQEADIDNFPTPTATAPYRIVIDNEVMEVTAKDEALNRLTVTRGLEGTTAVSHLALALVSIRLTQAGVERMQDAINALEQGLNTVEVRLNSGADVGQRPRINFIDGANADWSAVDSDTHDEVQVTLDVNLDTYAVAALPGGASAGWMAFATDGRKTGEGAGLGTGVMVYYDGTAWRRVDDGTTVAA